MPSVRVQFLLLFGFMVVPLNGQLAVPIPINNDDDLTLAETAAYLAREYFCDESTTVIVVERSLYSQSESDSNRRVSDYILKNLNETIAVQLFVGESEYQPWEFHILIVDSEEAFLNIASTFPENDFDGEFQFLVVLTSFSPTDYFRTMEVIFKACKKMNVVNVNILLQHNEMGVCMYKYKIFSEKQCHVVQPYLYFRASDGFEKLTEVFPKTLLDFHKCPIRVCGQLNHPMLTFSGNLSDPKPKDEHWSDLSGIDGQLIKIISYNLNFTIDLLPFSTKQTYIENFSGLGCYAMLLSKKADIAIGGFSGSDPKRIALTPSVLYHHSPVVFIVRGKRELDCVNRLGRPFSSGVWRSIIALLIGGGFLILTLRMLRDPVKLRLVGENNEAPLLDFFGVFLGYPVAKDPKGNLARYLLILWLVMTLVIRSAYQGSLYDSIRIDRFEKTPRKYEELFKHDYKFIITKSYLGIGIFNRNQSIILNRSHYGRLQLLAQLEGKYATVALLDHVISYLETNYRRGSDLRIIDEQIYQYQTAMFFQKHSIYATPINAYLAKFNYGGIMGHIVRKNAKDRKLFRDRKRPPPLRLNNDRIWSLYMVFIKMIAFTVGVFVLEVLSKYSLKVRILMNWFH